MAAATLLVSLSAWATEAPEHADAEKLARDNGLPMIFFDLGVRGNIARVIAGEKIGTTVHA